MSTGDYVNTGTVLSSPPEYDYSKVFAKLGGMINIELMDVYMNEEHPIFADDIKISADHVLAYPALVRMVYRLQDEMHSYAAQVVAVRAELAEVRQRLEAWEGDS